MEQFKIEDLSNGAPREVADKIIEILNIKDAGDIRLLHVEDQTIIADYFVICNGNTNTQLKSFAGEVEFRMEQCNRPPRSMEGYAEATWIVLDFSSVIVHIFSRESRDFYKLEKLYGDAEEVKFEGIDDRADAQ